MRRETRLTAGKDFRELYKRGKSVANKELVAYFLSRENSDLRVGFSISRRIGSAVTRNKIKRLLREAFTCNEARIKRGYDIVFIARQPIRGKSFHEVEKTFIDVLLKAGLLRNETDSHSAD